MDGKELSIWVYRQWTNRTRGHLKKDKEEKLHHWHEVLPVL
jgi:hypothetical protein